MFQQLAPAGAAGTILGFVAWNLWKKLAEIEKQREQDRIQFIEALKTQGEQHQESLKELSATVINKVEELVADYKHTLQRFYDA